MDVSPNNAEAHRRFGEVYFNSSRSDEALAEFDGGSAGGSPDDAQAYAGIGQLRLQQGASTPKPPRRHGVPSTSTRHIPGPDIRLASALLRLGRRVEGQKEIRRVRADAGREPGKARIASGSCG